MKPEQLPQTPHTRRGFLDTFFRKPTVATMTARLAGAIGIVPSILPEVSQQTLPSSTKIAEKDPQKILQLTGSVLAELGKAYRAEVDPAAASAKATTALGFQISNAYLAQDGFGYLWFQRGAVQFQTNGNGEFTIKPRLWNNLEEMHKAGFDPQLDNTGLPLGVTIPPQEEFDDKSEGNLTLAFKNRIEHFKIPPQIDAFVQEIRKTFETSAYSSHGKNYGPYTVYRTHRIAVQEWTDGPNKGLIQLILAGDAAKKAGFIPKEVQLPQPLKINFAGGGNGNGTGTEIFAPASKDIVTLGGKAKYHVIGDKITLTLSDPVLYEQIFKPLVDKSTGVEFFFYNNKVAPNSIDWANSDQLRELRGRLQNYQSDTSDIVYFGGFTNSFLKNTAVATGIRPTDGVVEIHMGLFPKEGANPTPEDIREHSFMLSGTLAQLISKATGFDPRSDPEYDQAHEALVERRIRGNNRPFPFTVSPA